MFILSKKSSLNWLVGLAIALLIHLFSGITTLAQSMTIIQVSGKPWGISTRYMGACEGNVNFDVRDLQDLGMNTYRIYGGMSRWEAEDDDGRYGWPSIAEIQANPAIINWDWWDKVMTNPPNRSDYWWSGSSEEIWQGNARTIFGTLKQAGIKPVLTIRNVDNSWNPPWALQLNPPRTEADWNEWWEHIFATVYWLNVRNDYRVDEFEIHNEPDNRAQGWGGTQSDYFQLVKIAREAIDFVYRTYLPTRTYHIHAPVTVGDSSWPALALQEIPREFSSVNIHDYNRDISDYIGRVRGWMKDTVRENSDLWVSEWGTYENEYDTLPLALNLIQNAIRGSQPESYIYGSHIFSLYDWGKTNGFKGLIGATGERRLSYYSLRMAIRVLQGGRTTFQSSTNNPDLMAIATQDEQNNLYLLVVNAGEKSHSVRTDLTALRTKGTGTMWEFSARVRDEVVGEVALDRGQASFEVPALGAIAIAFPAA
ncbi:hypothetical protein [Oscillatoria sp. FACHB-1406]|uniref:hypothetical protein n=1 Tax=Oscillatoria sp. FACHB-1406 TaxID=2692846 RepID=UPI0016848AA6|nr:hypothetical protein [Oscillatoria sp. FACHB-1406]MBD2578566.1 hypothetical protein [Oscillatoria sp. FACHB-1406]